MRSSKAKLRRLLSVAPLCCWLLLGCSGNPNLAEVSGTITLDGKTLPKAMITFTPSSGGATSFGKSDGNGDYRMMFGENEPGAWIGANRVSIHTGDVLPDNSGSVPEMVPAAYNSNSTLTKDVVARSNKFDFELNSKASRIDNLAPTR